MHDVRIAGARGPAAATMIEHPGSSNGRPGSSNGHRNVLLLQSLMGPLFRRTGQALIRTGCGVHKVNFNGGDKLFWRLPGAIDYRGTPEDWPAALARIIDERRITEVLLFGDCRPLHRAAIALCAALHIPVHVFEEGYIRPDWVTLELGGVNGHSSLPRDPRTYLEEAARLPPAPENHPMPSSFRRRALEGVAYNAADLAMRWRFPHWSNHRPWHPLAEGVGWLRRLSRRKQAARRSAVLLAALEAPDTDYMMLPLQLDADAQVRLHSGFDGVSDAIRVVIASFAAHAPPSLRLVIKEHPLDNGLRDWAALVAAEAARHGVASRVDYLEIGDIALLVRKAKGLITINSTTGTLALAWNVPVITLGRAVYDLAGITFQGRLDEFWAEPGTPDQALFAAFRRVLIERCLISGGFFSEEALETLVAGAVARLKALAHGRSTAAQPRGSP